MSWHSRSVFASPALNGRVICEVVKPTEAALGLRGTVIGLGERLNGFARSEQAIGAELVLLPENLGVVSDLLLEGLPGLAAVSVDVLQKGRILEVVVFDEAMEHFLVVGAVRMKDLVESIVFHVVVRLPTGEESSGGRSLGVRRFVVLPEKFRVLGLRGGILLEKHLRGCEKLQRFPKAIKMALGPLQPRVHTGKLHLVSFDGQVGVLSEILIDRKALLE